MLEQENPGQDVPGPRRPQGRLERGLTEHEMPDRGLAGHEIIEHGEWAEPTPGASADRRRLEADFLLAIRRAGSIMQLLGQVSADRIGINATDLNCLNLVALTGSMTAGELARATGLTTASITGVLDRLEEGGFVRRERDPHDRRRVIVHLGGDRRVGVHVGDRNRDRRGGRLAGL
jgi:DNA-binding MarR family transcriptional regulator